MNNKRRIDQILVDLELAPTREKAQSLILAGQVLINEVPVTKAGEKYNPLKIEIRIKEGLRFVGRGGDKLLPAISHFDFNLKDKIVIDVGSSTGGFTDCLLSLGATKSYCVDVGYNQLDYKLRVDPRVKVLEKLNAKDLNKSFFDELPNFLVMDLSFISVRKVFDAVFTVMADNFSALVLVKPQFELEKDYIEKGGVVKDIDHQMKAVELVRNDLLSRNLNILGSVACELKGAKKGNQEYFIGFTR